MNTEILKFTHDDGPEHQALISLVGHFISNPVISARLGAPITTKPGDIWLVAKEGDKPCGCCIITLMSWNQSLWIGTLRLIPGARRARLVVTQGINPVMQINRSSHLCHPFGRYPRPALGKSLHR